MSYVLVGATEPAKREEKKNFWEEFGQRLATNEQVFGSAAGLVSAGINRVTGKIAGPGYMPPMPPPPTYASMGPPAWVVPAAVVGLGLAAVLILRRR